VFVRDVYFTYLLAAMAGTAALLYGVRIAVRGVAHSDRVGKMGGNMLVGQGIMDWTYWAVEPIVRGTAALGITPNHLTWAALVLGLGAGVALAFGQFGLATLLATWSTIGDILDGQVARLTGTGSNRGEVLDAAVDRYTEFAFVGGLVFYFRESPALMGLSLGALLACFMVSYSTAKAEEMQVTPPRGLMRRHERAVYLIVGAGLTSLFGAMVHARWTELPVEVFQIAGLAMVAIVGNVSAVSRWLRIAKQL